MESTLHTAAANVLTVVCAHAQGEQFQDDEVYDDAYDDGGDEGPTY